MARVKRGVTKKISRRRIFERTKGFYGRRKNTIRIAKQAFEKSLQYSYRDRKARKRNFRSLWIIRINAACRQSGIIYSRFMSNLKSAGVSVDRKVLAELAVNNPDSFAKLIETTKPKTEAK